MGFHTIHCAQVSRIGGQDLAQVTKTGNQGLGQRLNIAPGDAEGQEQFQEGRISARRDIAVDKLLAQSLPVTRFTTIVAIVHSLDMGPEKQSPTAHNPPVFIASK